MNLGAGSDQIDYGLPLDRARAAAHAIAACVLIGVIDPDWPAVARWALVAMQVAFVLVSMWVVAAADDHRAHIVKPAATIFHCTIVAVAVWRPVAALFAFLIAVDTYTYHATALRRLAFFEARRTP